jgi:hypothetical protein
MQYVYCLKTKGQGQTIYKIGKTTRSPHQRLAEINKSWAARGIQWRIIKVMSVFDCHTKESELHRQFAPHRYSSWDVSQWLGGVCDGDSEIFNLDRQSRKKLLEHMGAWSWSFDAKTWIVLGFGVGLLGFLGLRETNAPPPIEPTRMQIPK